MLVISCDIERSGLCKKYIQENRPLEIVRLSIAFLKMQNRKDVIELGLFCIFSINRKSLYRLIPNYLIVEFYTGLHAGLWAKCLHLNVHL